MYQKSLTGKEFTVWVRMNVGHYTRESRGDHGMGGSEYTQYYGEGEVVICNKDGKTVAACKLNYRDTDGYAFSRRIDEKEFKACIEVEGLFAGRQEAYADWLAQSIITVFEAPNPNGEMPKLDLKRPDRNQLIELGFIAGADGQACLPLWDKPTTTASK